MKLNTNIRIKDKYIGSTIIFGSTRIDLNKNTPKELLNLIHNKFGGEYTINLDSKSNKSTKKIRTKINKNKNDRDSEGDDE